MLKRPRQRGYRTEEVNKKERGDYLNRKGQVACPKRKLKGRENCIKKREGTIGADECKEEK
jgi:hypothetical protein